LGNGSKVNSSSPVPVLALTTATAIATGSNHSCARLSPSGTVQCWGRNFYGQLGDGSTSLSTTPTSVLGLSTATQVAAGANYSCALLASGSIDCWGRNNVGQLGVGNNVDTSTPTLAVSGITTATAVAGGSSHVCALLGDGSLKCWGLNNRGQLGNGTNEPSPPQTSQPMVGTVQEGVKV
jgi:alpha-tubulin suppressor-like RCC1 family protein